MFVIVQGLLSDELVTQGYAAGVIPPPSQPVIVQPSLKESSGASGGYIVPPSTPDANRVLYGPSSGSERFYAPFYRDEDITRRNRTSALLVAIMELMEL